MAPQTNEARRPNGWSHGHFALVAAVVLHALLVSSLLLVSSGPAHRSQEVTAIDSPELDLALDLATDLPPEPGALAPSPAPSSSSSSSSSSFSSSASSSLSASASPSASISASLSTAPAPLFPAVAPAFAPTPAADPGLAPPIITARLAAPPISLALGAPNPFVTSAAREHPDLAPAPSPGSEVRDRRTTHDAKRAVDAALREPARKRERELGLGPEGPVLVALGEATAASTAPVRGRAVFLAIANGNGMVVGIDVVECDGGRDGWANAAALAREALQGKKLRMPSSATRAEMRIELTSAWKLPSGHDPGTDVSLFGVPVAKGEGKQSTKVVILDPIPKLRSVQIAPDVNVMIPTIGLDVLAVAGDPANIGAKPRRIVHTRLLDSKVL